jgi:hypothetical protein
VSVEMVWETLDLLARQELLLQAPEIDAGVSRREVVRKAALIGAGAAAAAPLVRTIVAPTPAHAVSPGECQQVGEPCSDGTDCCPGLTCVVEKKNGNGGIGICVGPKEPPKKD